MSREHVNFQCGDLVLEGVLVVPEGGADKPAVVVCHPHPLYGGDMYSHVVVEVCRQLEAEGIASLRFNFRGAGASTGSYAEGIGEQDDLRAAISFLESSAGIDRNRLGVAGYSFGAGVGAKVGALDDRVKALAAISLPPRLADPDSLRRCTKPKLFVVGSNDQLVPADELQSLVKSLPDPKQCLIVGGADHFWAYGMEGVEREIADFFSKTL